MDINSFPTKGNLLKASNSLRLAKEGYALIDKKRNILLRELMGLIEHAKAIQSEIDQTFRNAYRALERANLEMGIHNVEDVSATVPVERSVRVTTRSVMGTEIPKVRYDATEEVPAYSFYATHESLDAARVEFRRVKDLIIELSMVEISAYRLADSIQKTQKRANALNHITIPRLTALVKTMGNALEEKDREEFTRLKVIKRQKESGS